MVSDEHYDLCLSVLQDSTLEDEDRTDKLESVLKANTSLKGPALENAVLDVLWRYRDGGAYSASPPPIRHSILRRPSPASWRGTGSPIPASPRLAVSPLAPPGFVPPAFNRAKSSTASPFTSPRASPRLALATPVIPHSPNLNAYEFASDPTPATEILGDYQTENVEWLVSDDAVSVASSAGTASGLNAAAPEFSSSISLQQTDMSSYDILRSILGQTKSDEDIEAALCEHGHDLSATIASMMDGEIQDPELTAQTIDDGGKGMLGNKSANSTSVRPSTPVNAGKSAVICKFYLSTGQCLRADCRFSHDLSTHLCKYWVMGNCLAGDTCIFSHDPTKLVEKMNLEATTDGASTPTKQMNPSIIDMASFPSLQPTGGDYLTSSSPGHGGGGPTSPLGYKSHYYYDSPRNRSRPVSRQNTKENLAAPAPDDNEAFPSLGSVSIKQGKKHHGKRGGHGHGAKDGIAGINSMAEIVKMSPSPSPASPRLESRKLPRNGSALALGFGENSAAAQAIASPQHIPWLETGDRANKAYLRARQEAMKHGGLRNKFLQSAAQAWNRNDARAAKALSLRGQSENDLMRKAHREAARELYEERNKHGSRGSELYADLHGLHPEEAVEYLEQVLLENSRSERPVYAITGTGHHSKNGKDKVGKAIRTFLNDWKYAYREFSVPGDRNNMGGILGIDPKSWDKSIGRDGGVSLTEPSKPVDILSQGVEIGDGKMRLLVRDQAKSLSGKR